MIIGIDVGGTNTKIVGLKDDKIVSPILTSAKDPISSMFGAFGKFVLTNNIDLKDIKKVMITGAGSSYLNDNIYGIETLKVPEFYAIGLGGLYISGLNKALVVSMGTGTALVEASKNSINHIGGTGVGGGTIIGLSKKMLNLHDFENIVEIAKKGNLKNVDLSVGDIMKGEIKTLPSDTTASNFGKLKDEATTADIALGIINLVFESVGMSAILATKNSQYKDIVLIGNLTALAECEKVFNRLSKLCGCNFLIPKLSPFATAIGASLYNKG